MSKDKYGIKTFEKMINWLWANKKDILQGKEDSESDDYSYTLDFPRYLGLPKSILYNLPPDLLFLIQYQIDHLPFKTKNSFELALLEVTFPLRSTYKGKDRYGVETFKELVDYIWSEYKQFLQARKKMSIPEFDQEPENYVELPKSLRRKLSEDALLWTEAIVANCGFKTKAEFRHKLGRELFPLYRE